MITLHNYGARAIFLLFCDHTDTESESREIQMSISQPIFTNTNISKALWDNDINTVQDGRKNVVIVFNIYGALAISLLFCDYQDTESE